MGSNGCCSGRSLRREELSSRISPFRSVLGKHRCTRDLPECPQGAIAVCQSRFNLPPKRPLWKALPQGFHHHIRREQVMENGKFRLVTRSDFDGLVCAVLLREIDLIDEIKFVHPKDMQDGAVEVTANDITTNLPYVPGAHLVFDHHESETVRNATRKSNHIIDAHAPSAARVVYDYYGGKARFPRISEEMMEAVDKADAAQFSRDEILHPSDWVLLNYLMDPRTGLGRFREFRVSNYQLMMDLIAYCADHTIEQILALPDVKERVDLYFEHEARAIDQIRRCTTQHRNLVVLDLRNEDPIYACNRFMLYALYPEANISIHVLWGLKKQNTVFATGKSIIDRSNKTNVGDLMLEYGGGGHAAAGTCQVANDRAEGGLSDLIAQLTAAQGSHADSERECYRSRRGLLKEFLSGEHVSNVLLWLLGWIRNVEYADITVGV